MKANQWTLKSAKHKFSSSQKSRGPGGNLQGAVFTAAASEVWGALCQVKL